MIPFSKEHNQRTLNLLAGQGCEMTPDELDRIRKEAYQHIREELTRAGFVAPASDEEMFALLLRYRVWKEKESAL